MLLENLIETTFLSDQRLRRLPFQILILGVLCTALSLLVFESTPGSTRDFLGYWLASQFFYDGVNPYDALNVSVWRSVNNFRGGETLYVWNPPLLHVALGPLMRLPLTAAASIWFGVSVMFAVGTVLLCWPRQSSRHPTLLGAAAVSGLFIPLWFVFSLGQISLVLVFFAALTMRLIEDKRDMLAGVSAAVLCIKPHISFLFLLFILVSALRARRQRIGLSFLLALLCVSACAEILHPGIHRNWLGSNNWPPVLYGSSFAIALWLGIKDFVDAEVLKWILLIFPLCGICAALFATAGEKTKPYSRRGYVIALMLTPFFAPYGFIFDQSFLLPLLCWAFADACAQTISSRSATAFFWCFVASDLLIICASSVSIGVMPLLWYLPIVQVLLLSTVFTARSGTT